MLPVFIMAIENDDDRTFVAELYTRCQPAMQRRALSILKNESDAEEAVHEAILRVIRHLEKVQMIPRDEVLYYLVTVTETASIDLYRKRQRESRATIGNENDWAEHLADDNTAEQTMLRLEQRELLERCLAHLPQREIDLLNYYYIPVSSESYRYSWGQSPANPSFLIVVPGINHNGGVSLAVKEDIGHLFPYAGHMLIDPPGVRRLSMIFTGFSMPTLPALSSKSPLSRPVKSYKIELIYHYTLGRMLMLTEHEEKLIQRYYIYPKIAITAVIMALALGVPFILLEMIDDLVFHDEEVIFWGLYVYLGFAALYLILFCYCTLRAKLGMRKEEWQELQRRLKVRQQQSDYSAAAAGAMAMGAAGRLMQKSQNKTVRGAGTAAQVAGAVGAVATAGAMSAEIAHNAQAMAEAYGVPLPRTKGLRTVLVLLPLVILIGTYIPQYSHAHTAMQQNTLLVSQRIEEITKALDPVCEYISADDPAERYQDYGYRVIGYLRGMNTDAPKCYVYISLDSTGVLESLSYDEEIIMSLSLEENLSRIEKDFETLHRVLQKADIPTQSPELLTTYQLSEEFREAFLAGTYYQSIDCSENGESTRVYWSFETESEEEFDEYTHPRVYLYVRA